MRTTRVLALLFLALSGCVADGGPPVTKPASFIDIKFANTVRQRFDFSCGAATLATMLTYYWGRPTSELDVMGVLRSRYRDEDWSAMQQRGFSFDDLVWTAGQLGFEAQGAELPPEELSKADGPLIVHLNKGKFEHFSVLRTAKAGVAYLSDPVLGAVSLSMEEFSRQYTGQALAVWKAGAPLPRLATLGRPVAALDPSLIVNGVAAVQQPLLTQMIGR